MSRKVFLDCGTNRGQGLRQLVGRLGIDSSWLVEAFEPNANGCNTAKHLEDMPYVKLHNKAVYDRTGVVEFSIMTEDDQGSSIRKYMDSGICIDENHPSYRNHDCVIEVECVDISDILKQYDDSDFIAVKLDVEGSEFAIIRKILKDGTIKKINELFVEWHTPYLSSETPQTEAELKSNIQNLGVKLHDWH